ncbi:Rv0909 family putative TA system antitoxin [Corynebacterium endometrii]|uniref:Antitoxin n=1 Tax=Corynebacterium endometrii TaxID=2488819 RepID=A0A4P7QG54_9CORY|nr:Rv0909 family putative TA system antitoxin [Corynebacterium endometrii]QCB28400.1 hypothetical protein CENDO_05595 [Corynebacterium endometrii]
MSIMDKIARLLKTKPGRKIADSALDKVEQAANQKLGADKADQIGKARREVDKRLGLDDDQDPQAGKDVPPANPQEKPEA